MARVSVGGMGTVYKAQHAIIGKAAAVKVLNPELCTNRDIVNRFLKEAQATTTIKHPGIVDVIDFGYMATGHAYLIMEFLEGMTLAQRLKARGRMQEGEAAVLLRAICSALAAAHDKGIVHRDLKPDNIFLVPDPDAATGERPKLLDFGIAKLTDVGMAGSETKTGAVMGTPTYMSPEQCRGTGDVDHRADLYSLGCILYELVTGRPPFTNLGAGELIGAHIYMEPEPPSKHLAGITSETEALIVALLQKRPELRPQSAKELAHRLTAIAQQQSWIAPGAPSGITAPPMLEPERPALAREGEPAHHGTLPSQPAATTPYGFTPAPQLVHAAATVVSPGAAEQPTTLSGAAGQPASGMSPGTRRGIHYALFSAVIFACIGIVVVQLVTPTGPPAASAPVMMPTTTVTAPEPVKPEPVKPEPAPAAAEPAPSPAAAGSGSGSAPAPAPPAAAGSAAAGSAAAPKPARPPKPRPAPRSPAKSDPSKLLETDL